MKRLPLILLALYLAFIVVVSAEEVQYVSYEIEVKLDPEEHTLSGTQTLTYHNDSDTSLNSVYFVLMPNFGRERNPYLDESYIDQAYWNGFDPSWMKIESVSTADGQELAYQLEASPPEFQTYSLEDTLLRVDLPEELAPGKSISIKIAFTTKLPHMQTGDQCYHRQIYTWRFGWNPIAVPAKGLVNGEYISEQKPYYRYELPAGFYEVRLTVPADYLVAAGADHQEVLEGNEGWKTLELRSDVPTRSLAFSASPLFKRYLLPFADIPIEVYYLPGDEEAARLFATYAGDSLKQYRERYGEYGYKRLVIVESSATGLFGMAADALVILGNSWLREKDLGVMGMLNRLSDYVLAHEIAHQWWGIGVGTDFNAENWISEAFAEYLSISYFEEKYGEFGPNLFQFERAGLLEKLIEHQLGFYNLREHNTELPYLLTFKDKFDEAIIKPMKDVEYGNFTTYRIYNKGYLVLRALEGQLGKDTLREILKEAYERFNHRITNVQEFRELAEEVSGKDLEYFFHKWLYTADFVDYGVKGVKSEERAGKFSNEIQLFRRGEVEMPVEVVAATEDGEEIELLWAADKPADVLIVESESPVSEVRVDPLEMTPDVNRLNNYYPVKLRIITTGRNDLPLDAYLIRFDPTTQMLEGGFLTDHRWLIGGGIVALVIDTGRDSSLDMILGFKEWDIYGEMGLNFTRFTNPPVGSPSKFWEASERFRLSITRDLPQGSPVNYLGFDYRWSESISDLSSSYLSLRLASTDSAGLSLGRSKLSRILPNLYLSEEVELGLGFNLPETLKFNLTELRSFDSNNKHNDRHEVQEYPYPGNIKLLSKISLTLPLRREMDYNIASLALLDEIDETLFAIVGDTWESLKEVSFDDFKVEIGFEFTLKSRTLGGLFPLNARVGFAYPLVGIEEEAQQGKLYIELQVPLL